MNRQQMNEIQASDPDRDEDVKEVARFNHFSKVRIPDFLVHGTEDWHDASWSHDACPHMERYFGSPYPTLKAWVNFPESEEDKDVPGSSNYWICLAIDKHAEGGNEVLLWKGEMLHEFKVAIDTASEILKNFRLAEKKE